MQWCGIESVVLLSTRISLPVLKTNRLKKKRKSCELWAYISSEFIWRWLDLMSFERRTLSMPFQMRHYSCEYSLELRKCSETKIRNKSRQLHPFQKIDPIRKNVKGLGDISLCRLSDGYKSTNGVYGAESNCSSLVTITVEHVLRWTRIWYNRHSLCQVCKG